MTRATGNGSGQRTHRAASGLVRHRRPVTLPHQLVTLTGRSVLVQLRSPLPPDRTPRVGVCVCVAHAMETRSWWQIDKLMKYLKAKET